MKASRPRPAREMVKYCTRRVDTAVVSKADPRTPDAGKMMLRLSAAAELLDVNQHTLRRWADSGKVPCHRTAGGQRRFRRPDLERILRDGALFHTDDVAHSKARDSHLALLFECGRAVASASGFEEALDIVARRAAAALGSPECSVREYDANMDAVIPRVYYETVPTGWDKIGVPFPLADRPYERSVIAGGRPRHEFVSDPELDTGMRDALREWGNSMCLRIPIRYADEPMGLLVLFERDGERHFDDDELALACGFGELAAAAIHTEQMLRREREHTQQLASLLDASRAITSSLVLEEVLDTLAHKVVEGLGTRYCVIWEYLPADDTLFERAGYEAGDTYQVRGDVVDLRERPQERAILESREPVIETLSDPGLDPGSRSSMEEWDEKTCLSVPLRFGDEALGILVAGETERERRFTSGELNLAAGLAEQASVAIHNAHIYERLQARNKELAVAAGLQETVHEIGRELASSLDLKSVLHSTAQRFSHVLDVGGCDIHALEGDEFVCLASCVDGKLVADWEGRRTPLADWWVAGEAIRARAAVVVASPDDPRLSPIERDLMMEWDEYSFLAVPMVAGDRVIGLVELTDTRGPREFSRDEVQTAEALAQMAALAIDNATMYREQKRHAQRLTSLRDASQAMTSTLVLDDVLDAVTLAASETLGCPETLIFEYDAVADTITARSIRQQSAEAYDDLGTAYPMADFPSDRRLMEAGVIVRESLSDPDLDSEVRESMERHGEKTCLNLPFKFGDEPLGIMVLIESERERVFTAGELEFARGLSEFAAIAMHNARLYENLRSLHLGSLKALTSALTAKDHYTIGHTARVAAYAVLLADELGWAPAEVQQLELATYLHDIGKIAVSDRILLKAGALTDEEWTLMKQHPGVSAEIVEALLEPRWVAGVRHHHERYDGKGYPDGLASEAIPDVARLLCVVDSYDAMSSRRVYRSAMNYEQAMAEIARCRGAQFDPLMADAFVRVLARLDAEQQAVTAAAVEAARRIPAAAHDLLRSPADEARPEYTAIAAILSEVLAAHPQVEALVTERAVDSHRCMIVVDSDRDPESRIPLGEIAFSDDLEIEIFADRTLQANTLNVDSWGTWLQGAAPIRDDSGVVVGLVAASVAPKALHQRPSLTSEVSAAFAEIARAAAGRQTRFEIDAVTDSLTGLCNHRHLHEQLDVGVREASRSERSLSLLMCDVDEFARLNDERGHRAGDEALRRVAQALTSCVRRGDIAARLGGDDFIVVLPGADREQAMEVAERVRAKIEAAGGGAATVSIGIATMPQDGASKKSLLAAAEAALKEAKRAGRNQIAAARPAEVTAAPPTAPVGA